MRKAMSVSQVLSQKVATFAFSEEWRAMLGAPQTSGTWIIWGESGSGKSSFVLQLAKELSRFGVVLYDSLEEGFGLTLMNSLERFGMMDVNGRVQIISEDMETLKARLRKRKSPRVVIIDSIQYTGLSFEDYLALTAEFPRHLFIFSCQARGNKPDGRTATRVMYDSMLKIWIEGYRAVSKGRFIGPVGYYDIWPEKSALYWGAKQSGDEEGKEDTEEA